jgi:NADPH:quinone reductase-like Zn-dependent oxidoreductase
MKAWQILSFSLDHLECKEIVEPRPGPGEVLMKVHAVSVNYRDLLVAKGLYNPKMELPRIPCSDGAGEVAEIGEGVTSISTGQRVAGIFMQNWLDGRPTLDRTRGALGGDVDGMLAEYVLLREHGVIPVPQHLSYVEAATLPCAAVTAWNALAYAADTKPGDVVLVQGTGGVSIFALQFAKMFGARVLGISSSDEKLERARTLGLDAGLNYKRTPDWSRWVLNQTFKAGADLVVEVGGAGTLNQSLRCVRPGGVVAQIGVLARSEEPIQIPLILHRQVQLKGIYVGSRAHFEEMNRAIETNHLRPVVDEVFSFEESRRAFKKMEAGAHFGKIVIQVVA